MCDNQICACMQAGQLADRVKELEAHLARVQAVMSQQESVFALEKERLAPYFGHGLERLSAADLEALNSFHYKAINRLRPMLVHFLPNYPPKLICAELSVVRGAISVKKSLALVSPPILICAELSVIKGANPAHKFHASKMF